MLYRFGTARLDPDRRQLIRDGREQHVSPKAFDLLVALVDARPSVLTKDELMAKVWPNAFVSEANLAVLVGEVRTAIGDSARAPLFIKTHHAVGYSFVGEVTEVAHQPSVPLSGPTATLHVGHRRILLGRGASTVGRDADCDVVINDVSVSRRHARITVDGRRTDVLDLQSKNGTRVDGVRIDGATAIASGAVIVFGSVETTFAVELPDDTSTQTIEGIER